MKKPLAYTLAITSALLISSITTVAISNADTNNINSNNPVAVESELNENVKNTIATKNESVYVITGKDGAKNKTFINNTLETENKALPVELKISYYLDGEEISAEELAGKSGHVKIIYNYRSTRAYQNKVVPFLVVTGLSLDDNKFENIRLENGKIVAENNGLLVVGYAIAGANQDLGEEFLPEHFIIEADVNNFSLGTVYTVATNGIFTDIDTSKLNSVDEIIGSVNQLSSGLEQIIGGMSGLDSGIDSLVGGINSLKSGASSLAEGANGLAVGATDLSNGLSALVDFDNEMLGKAELVIQTITDKANELITKYGIDPATVAELLKPLIEYYNQIYTGVTTYTGNIEKLSNGAAALKDGASELSLGSSALVEGIDSLAMGAQQLSIGSKTLKSGLATFKASGIDKLVDFANKDLDTLTNNLRQTINAAKSYHYHSNPAAESVKFIFKTPSI